MDDREQSYRALAQALAESRDDDVSPLVVESYRAIVSTIHGDQNDPVPESVIRRANELFHQHRTVESWWTVLDRAVARFLQSAVDDGPSLAAGLRGDDLRQCTLEIDGIRLDLEIHVEFLSAGQDDQINAMVRGQLDGEDEIDLPMEGVVLESGSNHFFGHITTDERGRFNIELPAGSYDLVFRDGGGRHLIGTISVP